MRVQLLPHNIPAGHTVAAPDQGVLAESLVFDQKGLADDFVAERVSALDGEFLH